MYKREDLLCIISIYKCYSQFALFCPIGIGLCPLVLSACLMSSALFTGIPHVLFVPAQSAMPSTKVRAVPGNGTKYFESLACLGQGFFLPPVGIILFVMK